MPVVTSNLCGDFALASLAAEAVALYLEMLRSWYSITGHWYQINLVLEYDMTSTFPYNNMKWKLGYTIVRLHTLTAAGWKSLLLFNRGRRKWHPPPNPNPKGRGSVLFGGGVACTVEACPPFLRLFPFYGCNYRVFFCNWLFCALFQRQIKSSDKTHICLVNSPLCSKPWP